LLACSLAAETYKFSISEKLQVGQTELQPGRYALVVDGTNATLKDRKGNTIDVKANVEETQNKATATLLGIVRDNGSQKLNSITPGGTSIRVRFN